MTDGSALVVADGDTHFTVKGTAFEIINKDYNLHKTNENRVVILKGPTFLATYDAVLASAPTKNVLEFGVFEGGSLIYLALAFPEFRFVGIDIRKPSEAVAARLRDLGLQDRVKIYYDVSQADVGAISKIVADEFGNKPIGTIIDDASHNYNLSRKSFELTFGHPAR
jgi:cephalosporin hydroxylase